MTRRELASKNESAILKALAVAGQSRVAADLGVSESQVSRWKSNGEIAKTADLLAVIGLEVHEAGSLHMRQDIVQSLKVLAALGIECAPELMTEKQ